MFVIIDLMLELFDTSGFYGMEKSVSCVEKWLINCMMTDGKRWSEKPI